MSATNINRVTLTGNLTRDPELRATPGGTSVCSMRIAANTRRKHDGEWIDKPNFFNVTVWGAQADNCARFLSKGRPVAIDGRLEWREWTQDDVRREAIEIVADTVQFLTAPTRDQDPNGNADHVPAGAAHEDPDDIAF
ncbi:single-stranded DNA-binding protein [Solirubrobacter sp. CPCC 204708]|uniref:Single-stranded DNA-binding protein n=1 Tax=Solirubrobacter deserti TaxID=2282478 RepID=A0ABT4RLH7_9ACTN|nr:single-stranded DNA-binding protein [Solirubrobacter deserti]MBE2320383.1 single-stranded DNA-binding protein [Solirubrobacter deserti]MDA0139422.1 single-stranded DNA-binding protein [Solirubrobacter deserti]